MGQMLEERGIDFGDPELHEGCWLGLGMFDDLAFDIHTPEEWIALGADRPLAGYAAKLKGSVGEGPNQTNYSDRSSVRILAKFRNFR